ncbi:MAG TPA: (d)CMP kinase [Bacteroidales bacterium]|jgi:cytidylate kinase|nr:(d)CMP kinase [Bacteroidales bacterium]
MKRLTIAIDGFSSCGKSTMAKTLAAKLGYTYIDSGAMYRAVSLFALREGLINDGKVDEAGLKAALPALRIEFKQSAKGQSITCLNGENVEEAIRTMDVSNAVSPVSALPFVREALVKLQREAGKLGGVVMDGRDIGTVVFPNADLKIFVVADATIRAQRRYDELLAKGQPASFEAILENIRSRDELDQNRAVSPLRQAEDAILMDNGLFNIEQQDAWLLNQVNRVLHGTH